MRQRIAAILSLSLMLGVALARVSVVVTASPQAPAAKPADQLTRGKAVFDEWCAGCHARGPRQPGTQALEALYKGSKPAALEDRTDLVPTLTETFVRKGVSVMPPFRKTEISDAQLGDLAAYLAPKAPVARD